MSFQDKRKDIRESSKNAMDYYLDTVDPYFHGKIFEILIEENAKNGADIQDIYDLLEENGLNTHDLKRIVNNQKVFNRKFEADYDYEDFLSKSLSKDDFNENEKMINSKLIKYAEVVNRLTYKKSGENYSKLQNVLNAIELTFGADIKNKVFARTIDELKIRTISETSDKRPILKNVVAGKEVILTVKDMNTLFPNYFKVLDSEICDIPVYSKSETNGDVILDPMYSLMRMMFLSGYQNSDSASIDTPHYYVTKNNSLGENEAANLTFKEIESILETIKSVYLSKVTKNDANEKILQKFNKAILNTFKLKQRFINIKKISNSKEIPNLEVESKLRLIDVYTKLINKAEGEYQSQVFANTAKNKVEMFGNEILLSLLNENPKFVKELDWFADELRDSMVVVNNKLKNLEVVTNIPMVYRPDEKVNLIDTERDMTKRYFNSLITNEIMNFMSSPGQGKSRTIKSLTEALGYKLYIIEPTSDRETVTSYAVDNNVPTINREKLASKLSLIATSYLSGEKYNIVFFDELAKIAVELSAMNMGQKLNNLFQAALNPSIDSIEIPNPLNNNEQIKINLNGTRIIGASNYSISMNENIDSSFRSRIVDVDMDSNNCESKGYISGIIYDNINTLFDVVDTKVNNENVNKVFLNMYEDKNLLKTYKTLKKDKKYENLLTGFKNLINYNFSTEKYKELYTEMKNFNFENPFLSVELDKKEDKTWDIVQEIMTGLKLELIVDEIKEKTKLIQKRKTGIKNGEDLVTVTNDYVDTYHKQFKENKILSYLDLDKKTEEKFKSKLLKNRDIKDYVDSVYDLIVENKSVSYSKFFLDIDEDKNEELSKSKIKTILNDVVSSVSNLKVQLLKNDSFVNQIQSKMDTDVFNKVFSIRNSITENLKSLEINKIENILPLSNYSNDITRKILEKPDFLQRRISPTEFTYKKVKFMSPFAYPFKAESGVNDLETNSNTEFKENPVVSLFDSTDILSECIAKTNTYIRKEIQRKDDSGKFEDGMESDDAATSVNKILYRELNLISRELISKKSNITEGFDILPFFKKTIMNLKHSSPDIENAIKTIIVEVINNNKITAMNGAVFTKSKAFEASMGN